MSHMRKEHSLRAGVNMKLTNKEAQAVREALSIVKYYNHNPEMGCNCELCQAVRVAERHFSLNEPTIPEKRKNGSHDPKYA